jgi:hypothetical protein
MANAPVDISAPTRTASRQPAWGLKVIVAGLIGGSLAVAGAGGAVWQAARAPALLPAEGVWTDARIATLGSQTMRLGTGHGREWTLGLDFNYTSVFRREGGVLNIAHLRQGQQVKVLSGLRGGKMMAKAIEIKPLRTTMPAVN